MRQEVNCEQEALFLLAPLKPHHCLTASPSNMSSCGRALCRETGTLTRRTTFERLAVMLPRRNCYCHFYK